MKAKLPSLKGLKKLEGRVLPTLFAVCALAAGYGVASYHQTLQERPPVVSADTIRSAVTASLAPVRADLKVIDAKVSPKPVVTVVPVQPVPVAPAPAPAKKVKKAAPK